MKQEDRFCQLPASNCPNNMFRGVYLVHFEDDLAFSVLTEGLRAAVSKVASENTLIVEESSWDICFSVLTCLGCRTLPSFRLQASKLNTLIISYGFCWIFSVFWYSLCSKSICNQKLCCGHCARGGLQQLRFWISPWANVECNRLDQCFQTHQCGRWLSARTDRQTSTSQGENLTPSVVSPHLRLLFFSGLRWYRKTVDSQPFGPVSNPQRPCGVIGTVIYVKTVWYVFMDVMKSIGGDLVDIQLSTLWEITDFICSAFLAALLS